MLNGDVFFPVKIFATGSEDRQASSRASTSQDTQTSRKIDYIDLLESSIPCGLFAFTDDQAVRDEISVHLMKLSNIVPCDVLFVISLSTGK